ncbi:hypothetical protein ACH5RR_025110 [Cinchona calisaya]|uniref:Uncharacterized protein n=1 Tax=Cinchona calisaya TaxID=153742 RepID=A0ABD2YZS3_9GENT
MVEELAAIGATVHTFSRNEAELIELLQEWSPKGFKVTGSVSDAPSREQRAKTIERVSSIFYGKLNVLVNNVGTDNIWKKAIDFTSEDYNVILSTNLESCFHFSQLAYPPLKSSGTGNIIFISSNTGLASLRHLSVNFATKGAMNHLTRNLAYSYQINGTF